MRNPARDLICTRDAMLSVLEIQQRKRNEYRDATWVDVELDVMHHTVNCERSKRDLPDISRQVVKTVERFACGSTDYYSKFALYCAELALGISPNHKETK